mgnify:FL=1
MKHIGIGTAILFAAFVLAAFLDNPRERQQAHRERVAAPVYFPTPASIRPLPQPVRADYRPITRDLTPTPAVEVEPSPLRNSVNVTDAEQAKIYAALDLLMDHEIDQAAFVEEIERALGPERADAYINNATAVGRRIAWKLHPNIEAAQ